MDIKGLSVTALTKVVREYESDTWSSSARRVTWKHAKVLAKRLKRAGVQTLDGFGIEEAELRQLRRT
jgi:hypothetical protein